MVAEEYGYVTVPLDPAKREQDAREFIDSFIEMNDKAQEAMGKDSPETALEYLKRVDD